MNRTPWRTRDKDVLRSMHQSGCDWHDIARRLDKTLRSCWVMASRLGLPRRRRLDRTRDQDIRELHAAGLSDHHIARELGRSDTFIRKRRLALGLPANYDRRRRLGWWAKP